MSILINGLEMPKDGCHHMICIYADGTVSTGWRTYMAIPIPPHGGLIDADALLQRAVPHGWSTPKWVSDIAIDDAPTIIPASEEETGNMSILINGMKLPENGNETIIRIQPNGTILDQYGHHLIIKAVHVDDVVEVRHGRLLNPNPYGVCSVCGHLIDIRDSYNYCPNCGAKMDGGKEK